VKKLFFLMIGIVVLFGVNIKKLENPCNKGNAASCGTVGELFYAYKNYKKAAELFKKGCDLGNDLSCYGLGLLYAHGKGVKQDYKRAAELYKKACENGYINGCINIGLLYVYGKGVSKNYYKAYEYWQKAAKKGDSDAQHNLDILCSDHPWVCK